MKIVWFYCNLRSNPRSFLDSIIQRLSNVRELQHDSKNNRGLLNPRLIFESWDYPAIESKVRELGIISVFITRLQW